MKWYSIISCIFENKLPWKDINESNLINLILKENYDYDSNFGIFISKNEFLYWQIKWIDR